MTFYKGTSYGQDGRFINKDKKLIETLEFPEEYKDSVSIHRINLDIMRSWIERKLNDILGFEDECISGYIINQLKETEEFINPKKLQYSLTGFLENNTFEFMKDFWKILLSAQNSPDGMPEELIEDKKKEIINKTQKKKERLKFLDDLLGNSNKEENETKRNSNYKDTLIPSKDDNSDNKKNQDSSSSLSRSDNKKKDSNNHNHHNHHRHHHHRNSDHNHCHHYRNYHKNSDISRNEPRSKRDKSRSRSSKRRTKRSRSKNRDKE